MVMSCVPTSSLLGVPDIVAVASPLSWSTMSLGSPLWAKLTAG
jgi:hypothetical protein